MTHEGVMLDSNKNNGNKEEQGMIWKELEECGDATSVTLVMHNGAFNPLRNLLNIDILALLFVENQASQLSLVYEHTLTVYE